MDDYQQRLLIAMDKISHNFKSVIAEFQKSAQCSLSLHDCQLIEFIGNNSYTLNEIAQYFQVTPGTMSTHIEKVVNQGLVKRKQGEDRRKTYISLSHKGEQYYTMLHNKMLEFSKKALESSTEEEQQKIVEIFEKMARIDIK